MHRESMGIPKQSVVIFVLTNTVTKKEKYMLYNSTDKPVNKSCIPYDLLSRIE